MIKEITRKVVGYCDIPEEILDNSTIFDSYPCDCYIEYSLTPIARREEYSSNNWELDDWIFQKYPEIKDDEKILIELNW